MEEKLKVLDVVSEANTRFFTENLAECKNGKNAVGTEEVEKKFMGEVMNDVHSAWNTNSLEGLVSYLDELNWDSSCGFEEALKKAAEKLPKNP